MPLRLLPRQLASPDTLYQRASLGSRKYDYVAASKEQLRLYADAGDPHAGATSQRAIETLQRLSDPNTGDPRFTVKVVDEFASQKDTIWVFKINYLDGR
jgi:hypothetical protein